MHTLVLHNTWALGDTVCLTALARDIHRAYPGQYRVQMSGHYSGVAWLNNPHAQKAPEAPKGQLVRPEYHAGIIKCNTGQPKKHFLSWFHHSFEQATGLKVPVTEPRGDIHLSADERAVRAAGRYWVVVAGGKQDMTAKVWPARTGSRRRPAGPPGGPVRPGRRRLQPPLPPQAGPGRAVGGQDAQRAGLVRLIANARG
jgi:hypothetical protein